MYSNIFVYLYDLILNIVLEIIWSSSLNYEIENGTFDAESGSMDECSTIWGLGAEGRGA